MSGKNNTLGRRTLRIDSLERRQMLSATVVETEPNEYYASNSFQLTPEEPTQLVGEISDANDRDFFRFTAEADGRVSVGVDPNAPVDVEVETSQEQEVFENEPRDGLFSGSFRVEQGTSYRIRVRDADLGGPASYTVDLRLTPYNGDANGDSKVDLNDFFRIKEDFGRHEDGLDSDLNDDGGVDLDDFHLVKRDFGKDFSHDDHSSNDDSMDDDLVDDSDGNDDSGGDDSSNDSSDDASGDEKSDAVRVEFDAGGAMVLEGVSQDSTDKVFYVFTANADATATVHVASPNGNMPAVEIESAADVDVFETQPNDGVNEGEFALVAGQAYFLRARSTNDQAAEFAITIQTSAVGSGGTGGQGESGGGGQNPVDAVISEQEPNDRKSQATRFDLASRVQLTGVSESHDDRDFFRFTPTAGGRLTVSLGAESDGASVEIETSGDEEVLELEPQDGRNSASAMVTAGATYFLRARSPGDGPAEYLIDLAFEQL